LMAGGILKSSQSATHQQLTVRSLCNQAVDL